MYMALKCVNSIPTGKEFCFEIFCEMLYFHQNINMCYFDLVFVVFFKTCRVYTVQYLSFIKQLCGIKCLNYSIYK